MCLKPKSQYNVEYSLFLIVCCHCRLAQVNCPLQMEKRKKNMNLVLFKYCGETSALLIE